MAEFERHEHDVLVVGAGGAGLRAAIEAAGAGASVSLVCKSLLGKAHTVMAEGGVAAALSNVDERDSWEVHFADTMRGGQYLNDWRMAELHAREAPDRVRELEAWGALMDRTPDGRILQRNFGGHAYPRLAHVGDRTGLEMIRTLQDHGVHQGMDVFMECTVTRLLLDGGRVAGAFAYDRERGRFKVFAARSVVLATGGIGKAYQITSNSWEYTGDGHALAYHAGAELVDMEFIQFHPTGMVWPPSVRGILVTEGVRGEGGVLRNAEGRRFMFDDIRTSTRTRPPIRPKKAGVTSWATATRGRPPELLTRDHVARCIVREVKEGRGSPHGGAFLDIAWISEKIADAPAHIRRKLPGMYHQFKALADIDITKEPMEVGPTTHYVMGGVRVDADTQMSSVPGLFAAGECAAGLHGANRLGGNSLSDLLVFGKRAGEYAAVSPGRTPPRRSTPRRWRRPRASPWRRSPTRGAARAPIRCRKTSRPSCRTRSGSCAPRTIWPRRWSRSRHSWSGRRGSRSRATANTTRAGTRHSISTTSSPCRRLPPAPPSGAWRAAAPTPGSTTPRRTPSGDARTSCCGRMRTEACRVVRNPSAKYPSG